MNIRLAQTEDARSIAAIHKHEIKKGFLSTLPIGFLAKLYEAIMRSQNGFCVVAQENEKVIGFIAGTTSVKKVYQYFFFHYFFSAAPLLALKIFQFDTAKKIWEVLKYPQKEQKLPSAELLTIAVKHESQGEGIAGQMLSLFCEEMKKRDTKVFKVLVGEELAPAIAFYEKAGFRFYATISLHGTQKTRVYIYDIVDI
jgi:ribosomal protein S18 acetylase RimI-like enzyme